jgi:AcrR family transcriptional regulator
MRASGYLHMKATLPARSPAATRQRLLEAAARIYARDGLNGATTRAIAADAGVNEVTLFRHFKSKDRLLSAVVGHSFGEQPVASRPVIPAPTANLRADLILLARSYEKLLTENLPLVRAMLGEIHHHGRDCERQVFRGIFGPLKEALLARLRLGLDAGQLPADPDPEILEDLLGGMIFTGVLRRSLSHLKLSYSATAHLEAAVDLVLRGSVRETSRA